MSGSLTIGGEIITWRERPRQRVGVSWGDFTSKREWLFSGSLAKDRIAIAISTVVPAIDWYGNVARYFDSYELNEEGGGTWLCPVSYRSKPAHWDMTIRTSGGSMKMHQSYSTTRAYDCAGNSVGHSAIEWRQSGVIPDFKKAIGVHGDTVDGVDVPFPRFDFTVNIRKEMSKLNASYMMTLYELTGRANRGDYTLRWAPLSTGNEQQITFSDGDLRFMGANIKQTSRDELDFTLEFMASQGNAGGTKTTSFFFQPNSAAPPPLNECVVNVEHVEDLKLGQSIYIVGTDVDGARIEGGVYSIKAIGGVIGRTLTLVCFGSTGSAGAGAPIPAGSYVSADQNDSSPLVIGDSVPIKKKGWEYIWTRYADKKDSATGLTIKVPIATYIEQVVQYADFRQLGLG